MTEHADYDDPPRIVVEVTKRLKDGGMYVSRKAISLVEWKQARDPGLLAITAIDTALAELDEKKW